MKKKYLLFTLPVLILLLGIAIISSFFKPLKPAGENGTIIVVIPEDASSREVSKILYEKKLIKSPFIFNLYTRFKGLDARLKAGNYEFLPPLSLREIVDQLIKGQPEIVKVTVPEGLTIRQIAELLAEKGLVAQESFLKEAAQGIFDYPFLADLPGGPERLEGYLFPDTYHLSKNISAHDIIDLMLKRFSREMASLDYERRAHQAGLTLREALIIASLVEKEAKVDEERPVIAGVILNRLRKGMPLQIDATVQYALGGNYRPRLYYKDLEVDSPYNTYKITGLPPSPIASPGRASLLAVVDADSTDYLYYVARPDGTHAFARTLAEHNANKRRYQQ